MIRVVSQLRHLHAVYVDKAQNQSTTLPCGAYSTYMSHDAACTRNKKFTKAGKQEVLRSGTRSPFFSRTFPLV